jgi:septum formation protein
VVNPGEDPALPHLEDWPAACLRAAHKAARGAVARPGRVALGADTVVVYGRHTLGKPRDGEDAERMLEMLSGAEHFVYTAFCLALGSTGFQACFRRRARNAGLEACATRKGGRARKPAPRGGVRVLWLEVVRTRVRFRGLGPEEICDYVASGAPFDKAGGYGIQDRGAGLVEQIAGSYYNVVGLPVREVGAALRRVGWHGSAGARGRAA